MVTIWTNIVNTTTRSIVEYTLQNMATIRDIRHFDKNQSKCNIILTEILSQDQIKTTRAIAGLLSKRYSCFVGLFHTFQVRQSDLDTSTVDAILDDRIWLPFNVRVFKRRIWEHKHRLLSQYVIHEVSDVVRLEPAENTVYVYSSRVPLSHIEYLVFEILTLNLETPVLNEKILWELLEYGKSITLGYLRTVITRLRRKLSLYNANATIKCANRQGYYLKLLEYPAYQLSLFNT